MKKLSYLSALVVAACLISSTTQPVYDPAFFQRLTAQLGQYNQVLPPEKVYLHFDKPLYSPGDDIWFKAYLRDGMSHQASATSQII